MKALLAAAAVAAAMSVGACASTHKNIVIKDDVGGIINQFVKKYVDMRSTGERLVIDGVCASSCTLFLGILDPERYCATHRASLGFHSASTPVGDGKWLHAPEYTELMWSLYPENVRKQLRLRGWDGGAANNSHPEMIWIRGQKLSAVIQPCT